MSSIAMNYVKGKMINEAFSGDKESVALPVISSSHATIYEKTSGP